MPERVTIAQVAEEAGVSPMTVSNVMNSKPGASEETRRRVMEVAERLGYRPNVAARSLKAGRSGLVGLIALDLTSQYGLEILRGVADELASAEQELLVNATYHDAVREKDRVEFLGRGLVDGMLMIAPVLEDETIELLRRRKVPCVIIDPRRLDVPLPRLSADNYHGMRLGTQHLIDLGHTRIAYLRGLDELESTSIRFQAFQDAMRLAGLDVDRVGDQAGADLDRQAGGDLLLADPLARADLAAEDRAAQVVGDADAGGVGAPGGVFREALQDQGFQILADPCPTIPGRRRQLAHVLVCDLYGVAGEGLPPDRGVVEGGA